MIWRGVDGDLTHALELLDVTRQERDRLARQVEQDAIERAEMRRLIGNMQQLGIVQEQLGGLLAAPHAEPDLESPAQHVATAPTMDATPAALEPPRRPTMDVLEACMSRPYNAPGKYAPLVQYLVALPTDQHMVSLTLAEIEALVGPLAATPGTVSEYWTSSPVARTNWLRQGFTARLDRRHQAVTFTRLS